MNSVQQKLQERQAFYDKAVALSLKASKQMWKYIFIVLGIMLYISFLVMSTVFYYPSYYACMIKCGTLWSLANAIVQGIFFVFLVFYIVRQFLDTPTDTSSELVRYIHNFDKQLPYTLGICVIYLIVSYGIIFFQSRDPIECDNCSARKQTAFNTLVTTQVNRTSPVIRELKAFYDEIQKKNPRAQISLCKNYYDDGYLNTIVGGKNPPRCQLITDKDAPPTCVASDYVQNLLSADKSLYDNVTNDTNGGPMLCQFYVMTSERTCVVNNQYDGYMSPVMISIALLAGARCLDFDITNYSYAKKSFPIITNSRDYDKKNLQHNFVLFEDALKMLCQEWLQHKSMVVKNDPLFLKLNFHAGATKDCMDQVAYLLQYYLNEQYGNFLLPPQWQYKNINKAGGLGVFPICAFFGRIVIIVNAPCYATLPSQLLDGMTNALVTQSFQDTFSILPSKTIKNKNTGQRMELVDSNRKGLTFVSTSFHPFSLVGHQTCNKEQAINDSMTALLSNKLTINNDPLPAFATGCQFVSMNIQDVSQNLKTYLSVFNNASFILKPRSLWPTDSMTNIPLAPSTCDQENYTSFVKKDGTSCYEVCLPKVGQITSEIKTTDQKMTETLYTSAVGTLQGNGFTQLRNNDQACARGDKYQEHAPANAMYPISDQLELEQIVFYEN